VLVTLNCPSCGEPNFASDNGSAMALCRSCGAQIAMPPASVQPAESQNPFAIETGSVAPREWNQPTFDARRQSDFSPAANVSPAQQSDNPYQAPSFDEPDREFTHPSPYGTYSNRSDSARRFTRWLGAFIDSMVMVILMFAAIAVFNPRSADEANLIVYGTCGAVLLLQSILVAASGQSVGKMILGTKIVNKHNDEIPDFFRAVIVRSWFQVLLGLIPLYHLIDALCIFGEEKRCLHDMMAGTRVINIR